MPSFRERRSAVLVQTLEQGCGGFPPLQCTGQKGFYP